MPAPSQVPGVVGALPIRSPGRIPVRKGQGGSGAGGGGLVIAARAGIQIAFRSPALTDQPLWIRIDDPGS